MRARTKDPAPCGPVGPGCPARRSARCDRASVAALLALVATLGCAALLAACGGSSGGASPSSSAAAGIAPTPVPSPLITRAAPPEAAVDLVRQFWRLVGQGRMREAQRSLVAPGSPIRQWDGADIGGARFVDVVRGGTSAGPPAGATVEFAARVWIEPAGTVTPWGEAGTHDLFESVVRMSDGSWRMWASGTGP